MNMILQTEEKEILRFLKDKGCCSRCCLRLVGIRTPECYQDPGALLQDIVGDKETLLDITPCAVCLGILQDQTHEDVTEAVKAAVQRKSYDSTTFICALTVPITTILRERSMQICMNEETHLSENTLCLCKLRLQSIKDVWKWTAGPKIEQAIKKQMDITTPSPFLIEIFFNYPEDEKECKIVLSHFRETNGKSNQRKKRRDESGFSRKGTEALMSVITDKQFAEHFPIPPGVPPTHVAVDNVICSHGSIFIGGRYTKLSRVLSQTPWFINGEKKMETSVQDILCNPIAEAVKAQSIKFLSSGREDVDVRNIYSGRPFAVELVDPCITNISDEMLSELVDKINSSTNQAQITSRLKVVSRLDLKTLKEGENAKTKIYRALCICRSLLSDPSRLDILNSMRNVKITQKTPVRVLHRRPLSPRERVVHAMRARWAKPTEIKKLLQSMDEGPASFFVLDIKVQAGTYIKEFVHGDFGRTTPSLCDLLDAEVDIVALDVTGINLEWP